MNNRFQTLCYSDNLGIENKWDGNSSETILENEEKMRGKNRRKVKLVKKMTMIDWSMAEVKRIGNWCSKEFDYWVILVEGLLNWYSIFVASWFFLFFPAWNCSSDPLTHRKYLILACLLRVHQLRFGYLPSLWKSFEEIWVHYFHHYTDRERGVEWTRVEFDLKGLKSLIGLPPIIFIFLGTDCWVSLYYYFFF